MSVCIQTKDFNNLSKILVKQYKKGKVAILDKQQTALLKKVSSRLSKIFKKQGVVFNQTGFENLVKRLCPTDNLMLGGEDNSKKKRKTIKKGSKSGGSNTNVVDATANAVDDTANVVDDGKQNRNFTYFDFLAIVIFVASIFVAFVAYLKLSKLISDVSGMDEIEVSVAVREHIQSSIAEAKEAAKEAAKLSAEELSYFKYIYGIIKSFTCGMVKHEVDTLTSIVSDVVLTAAEKNKLLIAEQVKDVCGIELLNKAEWGTLADIVNYGQSMFTITETSACALRVTARETAKMSSEIIFGFEKMVERLSTQGTQLSKLMYWSAGAGSSSFGYLSYRIRNVMKNRKKTEKKELK